MKSIRNLLSKGDERPLVGGSDISSAGDVAKSANDIGDPLVPNSSDDGRVIYEPHRPEAEVKNTRAQRSASRAAKALDARETAEKKPDAHGDSADCGCGGGASK